MCHLNTAHYRFAIVEIFNYDTVGTDCTGTTLSVFLDFLWCHNITGHNVFSYSVLIHKNGKTSIPLSTYLTIWEAIPKMVLAFRRTVPVRAQRGTIATG
jgi:hypothetical protein